MRRVWAFLTVPANLAALAFVVATIGGLLAFFWKEVINNPAGKPAAPPSVSVASASAPSVQASPTPSPPAPNQSVSASGGVAFIANGSASVQVINGVAK